MMGRKNMKKIGLLICMTAMLVCGCEKQLLPAEVIVIDPVRHYYPVVQGETMSINYEIENISDNPLFIQEVQTTCGCLVARDDLPIVILPHKQGKVHLEFNTLKNNGYVEHFVECYGNFKDTTVVQLQFDTNVVPQADYFVDYEQLWKQQEREGGAGMREFVDGGSAAKGYYTEDGVNPRERKKKEIQDAIDGLMP